MSKFRSLRLLLMALVLCAVPASSFAGVFISVGFAPPVLPVYDVPPCPEAGWIWTPGYWAYGNEGYYWVPGSWAPAPFEGALWTPGYWGWGNGLYVWHPGYWGNHVGYYGGINYGGGYFGIGFEGGEWRGHDFFYNTEVIRVGPGIRFMFRDRGYMDRAFVDRDHHIAFSGGPGGVHHEMMERERFAEHEHHIAPTEFQMNHESHAMGDRNSYFHNNNGRPVNPAMDRPAGWNNDAQHRFQDQQRNYQQQMQPQHQQPQQQFQPQQRQQPQPQQHQQPQFQPQHQQPQQQFQPQQRQQPQPQQRPQTQPQQSRPQAQPEHTDHSHDKEHH
jgi:hypothetical protein